MASVVSPMVVHRLRIFDPDSHRWSRPATPWGSIDTAEGTQICITFSRIPSLGPPGLILTCASSSSSLIRDLCTLHTCQSWAPGVCIDINQTLGISIKGADPSDSLPRSVDHSSWQATSWSKAAKRSKVCDVHKDKRRRGCILLIKSNLRILRIKTPRP